MDTVSVEGVGAGVVHVSDNEALPGYLVWLTAEQSGGSHATVNMTPEAAIALGHALIRYAERQIEKSRQAWGGER